MNSPFPGMNPHLENPAYWPDFHHRFLDSWCEAIASALPENYDARLDGSVNLVQLSPEVIQLIYPDISVSRESAQGTGQRTPSGGAMLLEPTTIPHEFLEEVRQANIEILHLPDRTLVTVLVLLSPFNKRGDGFEQYRAKRAAILQQKVNLVEFDLLLAGRRPPLLRPLPTGDYFAYLSRVTNRPNCEVYPWSLRERLPTIPVPLRAPNGDIHVDLAEVFRETYKRGRYSRVLRYDKPPEVPLSEADLAWAAEISNPRRSGNEESTN